MTSRYTISIVLALSLAGPASAYDPERAMANLAGEFATCSAYLTLVSTAMKENDANTSTKYLEQAAYFRTYAIEHGQRWRARRSLASMLFTMRLVGITGQPVVRKMRRHAKRLLAYLETNADSLPDYGLRHRAGEWVASSFIESAVNQLVDKRMSKSQQMRWSHAGAHRLLQVRAEVVDGRLGEQFERWYPSFARAESLLAAA